MEGKKMAQTVYYIMKEDSKGVVSVHADSRNEEYIKHEFSRLMNIPNTRQLVKGQWIKHEITGVQFWLEKETFNVVVR